MTKILSGAAVVGLLVASSSGVLAKGPMGASSFAPGHEIKAAPPTGPTAGFPGASGYAPGQQMRSGVTPSATAPGNGAAVYAPGFLK
jgi:hypothetical protein